MSAAGDHAALLDTVIRPATEQDIADVHRLLAQLADATGLTGKFHASEEDLRRDGFSGSPLFQTLVAERDGGVIGLCLYFYSYSSWRGSAGVYVQDLVVDSAARGGRVGERLLAETARRAQQRGATYLRLSVQHDNTHAIRFYERCGLALSATERIFEADADAFDALTELA